MSRISTAAMAAFGLALACGSASAALYKFDFAVNGLTASGTIDEVGGQAISGSGTVVSSLVQGGSQAITLVTLSTPNVHDLGNGALSYRFGGGTDLIGDTVFDPAASPIVSNGGLVFLVAGTGDNGLNIYSNSSTDYAVFVAGNSNYNNFDGGTLTTTLVPEPAAVAVLGFGLLGIGIARRRAG